MGYCHTSLVLHLVWFLRHLLPQVFIKFKRASEIALTCRDFSVPQRLKNKLAYLFVYTEHGQVRKAFYFCDDHRCIFTHSFIVSAFKPSQQWSWQTHTLVWLKRQQGDSLGGSQGAARCFSVLLKDTIKLCLGGACGDPYHLTTADNNTFFFFF